MAKVKVLKDKQGNKVYPITSENAVLDESGNSIASKVSGKVDKVTGKGLSTNDYTDAEKAKVASALTQHQDISGKQDKLVAGSGITIAEDGKTISASGGGSSVTVVDGLTSDSSTDALSAKQGKVLNGSITDLALKTDNIALQADYIEEELDTRSDYDGFDSLPKLCGQPMILFGNGTPQEAVVPYGWKQFLNGGYNWNGLPSAVGQVYINTSATSNGRYTAYKKADGTLAWLNF